MPSRFVTILYDVMGDFIWETDFKFDLSHGLMFFIL